MKIVQINNVKVRIFEEDELKEKLGMKQNDIELVLKYQRTFPELLQDDSKGFINSTRKLYLELGLNESQWSRWNKKNIIDGKFFKENEDWKVLDMESTTLKGGQIAKDYTITIEMAKHLCMKVDNVNGYDFRQYFIIIEKTLRNYEKWITIRFPEKENAKLMKSKIADWCDKNGYDKTLDIFYTREFNLLNESLTGLKAQGIKGYLNYKDIQTREHLNSDINASLDYLQKLNISLLDANMSFEERSKVIKITCDNQYSNLKITN